MIVIDAIASRVSNAYQNDDMLQLAILTKVMRGGLDLEQAMIQKLMEAVPEAPLPEHLGQYIDVIA